MLSGIDTQDGYINGAAPQYVRYAKTIKFKVSLDPDNAEMLYVPYLEIEYRERRLNDIKTIDSLRFSNVQFVSEYMMDTSGFWGLARGLFITLLVILGLTTIIRVYILYSSDRLETDQSALLSSAIVRCLTLGLELFSNIFFWYMFAMSAWWFIFYKL